MYTHKMIEQYILATLRTVLLPLSDQVLKPLGCKLKISWFVF